MSKPTSFPRFPDLPVELRVQIWKLCLPSRVIELNLLTDWRTGSKECDLKHTFLANHTAPALWSVSREAREVALIYCGPKLDRELQNRHGSAREDADDNGNDLSRSMLSNRSWQNNMIDVLTQQSTDPELPGFWFNPRTDTPVLYHHRHYQGMQGLVAGRTSLYGRLAQGTAVLDPRAQPWPVCRLPECPHGPLGHGVPAMPACGWKNPLMVVDVIAIHSSNEAARQSGLFGLLGDESVQLVDVDDKNQLEEYWEFMSEAMEAGRKQTRSAIEWCHYVMEGPCFLEFLAWVTEARTREVWRAWKEAKRARFEGITNPWGIWRVRGDVEPLDMLDPASFATGRSEFNMDKFWPNKKHPWVRGVLAGLPSFRACLMIRHCADETCLDCPERRDKVWEEKEERWCV